MAIERIDRDKCVGCGQCVNVCSCDVIRMGEDNMPYIRYPDECCLCLYCREDCPTGAIFISPEKNYKQLQAWG